MAEETASRKPAMLLANHGPIASRSSLAAVMDAIEELEETAKQLLLDHATAVPVVLSDVPGPPLAYRGQLGGCAVVIPCRASGYRP